METNNFIILEDGTPRINLTKLLTLYTEMATNLDVNDTVLINLKTIVLKELNTLQDHFNEVRMWWNDRKKKTE